MNNYCIYCHTNIIACCQNRLHTAYGYHWQYTQKNPNYTEQQDKRKKEVFCVELNKEFESTAQASRELKISRPNISRCCEGKIKSAGGYHWAFKESLT